MRAFPCHLEGDQQLHITAGSLLVRPPRPEDKEELMSVDSTSATPIQALWSLFMTICGEPGVFVQAAVVNYARLGPGVLGRALP